MMIYTKVQMVNKGIIKYYRYFNIKILWATLARCVGPRLRLMAGMAMMGPHDHTAHAMYIQHKYTHLQCTKRIATKPTIDYMPMYLY